jgi:hypothetical protein
MGKEAASQILLLEVLMKGTKATVRIEISWSRFKSGTSRIGVKF